MELMEAAMESTRKPTTVFVHGILSSGDIFAALKAACAASGEFDDCLLFEYDYHRGLEDNGNVLATLLGTVDGPVVLICHSMGGLVGRLAVLTGRVPHVKRLIMLATPNFGAIRTSTAGLLAQLVLRATGRVSAIFRHPGILELTRAPQIMAKAIAKGEPAARAVEYVSIPGLYFHEGRGSLDFGHWSGTPASTKLFAGLNVGFELMSLFPLWAPQVQRPHDGIVEERSNAMVPEGAGRRCEKHASIADPDRWGYTYAHVSTPRCDELNHVMIHSDPAIIDLVVRLGAARSLREWQENLTPQQRLVITVEPKYETPRPPEVLRV